MLKAAEDAELPVYVAVVSETKDAAARAIRILTLIESQFGAAIDDDEDINGAEAVDFITALITEDIRPLLDELE